MICERCKRRFGRIGENYWNVKHGICPSCEKYKYDSSPVASSYHENKKLG